MSTERAGVSGDELARLQTSAYGPDADPRDAAAARQKLRELTDAVAEDRASADVAAVDVAATAPEAPAPSGAEPNGAATASGATATAEPASAPRPRRAAVTAALAVGAVVIGGGGVAVGTLVGGGGFTRGPAAVLAPAADDVRPPAWVDSADARIYLGASADAPFHAYTEFSQMRPWVINTSVGG
ncbi:hypothetical protein [Microbacterium sp.]|uniref:hypothetical protein n=1 Tax=Microbacterium sp. TaxID=51671 RepID=UPI003A863F4E